MWDNVERIILRIESLIDFESKITDLYYSKYCSKEDEDFSLQSSGFIRELVKTKKPFGLAYGFKSHCTSINERFYELEDCLQSRPNNQNKIIPTFCYELLPPSRNIILKGRPILYPLKQKDLCDYNPTCIM